MDAVIQSLSAILAALEEISLGTSKEHKWTIRAKALGLTVLMRTYSFVVLMFFLQKLLNSIFVLSNYFQQKDIDIAFAKQLLDCTIKTFSDLRTDEAFKSLNSEVKAFIEENCCDLDVETELRNKRLAKKRLWLVSTVEMNVFRNQLNGLK